jgi:hypothetical protein
VDNNIIFFYKLEIVMLLDNTKEMYYDRTVDKILPGLVTDYNVLQGVTHPSDLTTQILRNYNVRYVTVENSSQTTPVGISITNAHDMRPTPPIKFSLAPGEIRHIGINTIGEQMQYLHILDLTTKAHLGEVQDFRTDANQFVLREGINKWFVSTFKRAGYVGPK